MILSASCVSLVLAAISAALFVKNLRLYLPLHRNKTGVRDLAVSVLIPARNESENIAAAIQSVLNNEGAVFEVIVADDHSEDDTASVVQSFAERDRRVRLISTPP